MLQANNVHFCIKNRPIIHRLDISLTAGELKVIMGPNGAGKSSLFRILSGEASCKHGLVTYNGKPINRYNAGQLARVRAVMPQSTSLSFPFRAKEVVEMGLMKTYATHPQQIVQEIMEETNTWQLKDQLYGSLSGGEKQRVQLSRALAQVWEVQPYPRYLLLDEPTSSMDIAQQHQILHLLTKLKKRNIGVLAILHDLNLAALYADSLVFLKKGLVIAQGNTKHTLNTSNLYKTFDYPIEVISHPVSGRPLVHPEPVHSNFHKQINLA